jgi:hypothetical protein
MWHVLWITEIAGKPEGKRPLESPMRRWKDNINVDLKKVQSGARKRGPAPVSAVASLVMCITVTPRQVGMPRQ